MKNNRKNRKKIILNHRKFLQALVNKGFVTKFKVGKPQICKDGSRKITSFAVPVTTAKYIEVQLG